MAIAYDCLIIGGGAAGYFAAIQAAEANPTLRIAILEGTGRPLTKVRISGGGRCNVTHHCFEPPRLVGNYPRGVKELLGPFTKFGPLETVEWFKQHGVTLLAESDGRMFPSTNKSTSVIECLMATADRHRIEVHKTAFVKKLRRLDSSEKEPVQPFSQKSLLHERHLEYPFEATGRNFAFSARRVLLATGSSPVGHQLAANLGHTITPLAPSLFTFNCSDHRLKDLAGLSLARVSLSLKIDGSKRPFIQSGSLLVTHWGLSGPAVLKLSAFAAAPLLQNSYEGDLTIDLLPELSKEQLANKLKDLSRQSPKRLLANMSFPNLPQRFWNRQLLHRKLDHQTGAHLSQSDIDGLVDSLKSGIYRIDGKGVFKEEFVTCGGIKRQEIDFRSMTSKVCPGLYLAGEIIDVDGITGGFNFQNAWTGGYLAGRHMSQKGDPSLGKAL